MEGRLGGWLSKQIVALVLKEVYEVVEVVDSERVLRHDRSFAEGRLMTGGRLLIALLWDCRRRVWSLTFSR